MNKRIPIVRCPCCKHSIIYSFDHRNKKNVIVHVADDNYSGIALLCSKCKTMLGLALKTTVIDKYNDIPDVDIIKKESVKK